MRIVCHLIFRKNSFTIGSIKSDDCISKLVDAIKEMIQKKRSIINIIHLALYLYVIYDYNIIQRRSINYLFYIYIFRRGSIRRNIRTIYIFIGFDD